MYSFIHCRPQLFIDCFLCFLKAGAVCCRRIFVCLLACLPQTRTDMWVVWKSYYPTGYTPLPWVMEVRGQF